MTIHFGKGVLTMTTPDGREDQYEVVNFRFDPVNPTDNHLVVDQSTDFKYANIDCQMRIVDMYKELFREFVVKQVVLKCASEYLQPPKNKPYYRQFEKRGKW